MWTADAILDELKRVVSEHGSEITRFRFRELTGIGDHHVDRRWGNWTNLRRAAGLPVRNRPRPVYSNDELLGELNAAARQVDKYPTRHDFDRLSDRCWNTLDCRFGRRPAIINEYRSWLERQPSHARPKFLDSVPPDCDPTPVPGVHLFRWQPEELLFSPPSEGHRPAGSARRVRPPVKPSPDASRPVETANVVDPTESVVGTPPQWFLDHCRKKDGDLPPWLQWVKPFLAVLLVVSLLPARAPAPSAVNRMPASNVCTRAGIHRQTAYSGAGDLTMTPRLPAVSTACALSLAAAMSYAVAAEPEGVQFFREKIEPVLKAHCYRCHSDDADDVKGGLKLDSRAGVLHGGDSGPAVVAGKSGESLLIQALRHENGLAMPPNKPRLPDATIELFVRWIEMGVPDPRDHPAGALTDLTEARKHWAFQPVRKPAVPDVAQEPGYVVPDFSPIEGDRGDTPRLSTPIDAFVLAKLQERGWTFSPPATRAELIRRVTFDLIGLPPTPEEIDDFERDTSVDAYERIVDRLLGSQHYGERWAQHWLDVVRFAETEGYEYDRHVPDAWRFRDYVIDAFNRDKPFDEFLREQIAGDEIGPDDAECLSASIFHRLGPVRRNAGNPDIALSRNEVLTERTDILGAAFLGLTVGCARCHNHKLEPISQKDYYRLQAYFAATAEHNIALASADEQRAWERETQQFKDELQRLKKLAKDATGVEKERLNEQIESLEEQMPPPLATIPATINDFAQRTPIHVLKRGVWENKGDAVGPRPLSVLVADDQPELPADVSDPRTQLAGWLASPQHPLTARVIVNRLWQQHFGVGLVKTANDFGLNGERPSHPALLDWLAATLIESGWRLKPIHRQIVLSQAYRQSSHIERPGLSEMSRTQDPENRLLWRFHRRRLSAEETRDAMLAVSGRLNPRMHGPSVIVPVDAELVSLLYKPSQWAVTPDPREHDRRSIYLIAKRNPRLPFFENLDAPALQTSCARRESSTHAPQALELLNGTLSNELAQAFAERLQKECGDDAKAIVERAYRLTLGRPPAPQENELSIAFLRDQPVSEFALALFNMNGFLYVP